MKQIPASDLLEEVTNLTPEQRIFIDFPVEVINRLELLGLQIKSAEALNVSYINNTTEVANELNLENFLTKYAEKVTEKDFLFKDTVLKLLGTEVFKYFLDESNKAMYFLDSNLKKLVIRKQGLFNTDNERSCSC